jgi:hypothetical protein
MKGEAMFIDFIALENWKTENIMARMLNCLYACGLIQMLS